MPNFATPAPIATVMNLPAGSVRVVAGDRAETTVAITPADPGKSRDVKAAEQTTAVLADGVLRIDGPAKNQYFGPTGAIQAVIELPAGSAVEVKASSVQLTTEGALGAVTVATDHGDLNVAAAATAQLATTAGSVTVGQLADGGEIRTSSGSITVTQAAGGALTLRTDSGAITVGAAAGVSASLDASTSNGRVSNALKNDGSTQLAIHATTANGDITATSH
ncbi:hypothetical protein BIV57_01030 [Mangrovactinospora gilvigrisea]|uniref:DUF4097 domain-containing protein n=1 Tax=Mangrovactinospora gilvigrisea TaxID=1428644 RepID=A0A1J7C141_9ACTN|nr:DUF4097 family beta strand repeat-containing protein [Mangrovactinospora gilvigrisea]OIV39449.1 hypothetical protein BIV57_01030 [Mangrovactinospora gilvigrisea]